MPSALHFTMQVSGPDQITAGRVQSMVERYSGVAQLTGAGILLEWNGQREHSDVAGGSVTSRSEVLPLARREIPARLIVEATLRRRWWKPYIRIRVSDLGCLHGVPGAAGAECRLRVAREDRHAATEFLIDLRLLAADVELSALEGPAE